MKKAEFVTNSEFAKVLYNLYRDVFNRYEVVSVPMEVDDYVRDKYIMVCEDISDEEIWAYSNHILNLCSYEQFGSELDLLDQKRKWPVGKQQVLLNLFKPVYKISLKGAEVHETIYTDQIEAFILEEHLGKELFYDSTQMKDWLWLNHDSITFKEMNVLLKNIESFLSSSRK